MDTTVERLLRTAYETRGYPEVSRMYLSAARDAIRAARTRTANQRILDTIRADANGGQPVKLPGGPLLAGGR